MFYKLVVFIIFVLCFRSESSSSEVNHVLSREMSNPQKQTFLNSLDIQQSDYLKASNTDVNDEFGKTVAVSEDIIVVGSRFEDSNAQGINGDQSDNSSQNSGAAYVLVRDRDSWIQQAYLKASNAQEGGGFGTSVAVSGGTIVVGASGFVYVFVRNDVGKWIQQAYLKASNSQSGAGFGDSVAIYGDTIAVGAPFESINTEGVAGNRGDDLIDQAGAVYVFIRKGNTWSQNAYIKASNSNTFDLFGTSVALSDDTLVVGALEEDSNATDIDGDQNNNLAPDSGAAYIFERNDGVWKQQAYLKAFNTEEDDNFGKSVAVSDNIVVVSAPKEGSSASGIDGDQSNNFAPQSGAAYVFVKCGDTWIEEAYIKASNTERSDQFGTSIAISKNNLVIGARIEDSNSTGINGNEGNNSALGAGAAYLFTRRQDTWVQDAYLKASNTNAVDFFGSSVAISGDALIVGALGEDSSAIGVGGNQDDNLFLGSGASYIFEISNRDIIFENGFDCL